MTKPLGTEATTDKCLVTWPDRLAGPMFFLALLFLIALAGLIHRFPRLRPDDIETRVIYGVLGVLWPVFLARAAFRFHLRDRCRPAWKSLAKALACGLLPPLQMGCRGLARPDHLWLPMVGWKRIDAHLRSTLDRFFSVPMIFFALLVLPLFVLEYYWAEQVRSEPILALCLDIGTSLIWLAFAIELILMAAVAVRPVVYCLSHWIDMAVVLLPVIEVLPLFRVLRLGRVLRLEQLLRWGRLYRLQALAMRGWRALLLLQVVQRLTGRSKEQRLKQLQELLQAKDDEMAELRQEINELEMEIDRKVLNCQIGAVAPQEIRSDSQMPCTIKGKVGSGRN